MQRQSRSKSARTQKLSVHEEIDYKASVGAAEIFSNAYLNWQPVLSASVEVSRVGYCVVYIRTLQTQVVLVLKVFQ